MGYELEGIKQIEFTELFEIYKQQERSAILLDVREIEEYIEGHIPGIPLLPMGDVVDVIDQFKRDKEYIIVCRSGRRSQEVAKFFQTNGINKVSNYAGGMLEWNSAIATGEENVVTKVEQIYNR